MATSATWRCGDGPTIQSPTSSFQNLISSSTVEDIGGARHCADIANTCKHDCNRWWAQLLAGA